MTPVCLNQPAPFVGSRPELLVGSLELASVAQQRRFGRIDARAVLPCSFASPGGSRSVRRSDSGGRSLRTKSVTSPSRARGDVDEAVVERPPKGAEERRVLSWVLTETDRSRGGHGFQHDVFAVAIETGVQEPDEPGR